MPCHTTQGHVRLHQGQSGGRGGKEKVWARAITVVSTEAKAKQHSRLSTGQKYFHGLWCTGAGLSLVVLYLALRWLGQGAVA